MKNSLFYLVAVAALIFAAPLYAEEAKTSGTEALQAKFKETMTGVTMAGRWCPVKDGVLGEEKEDRYEIVNVEKGTWRKAPEMTGLSMSA
jgi:hypothetical protein